MVANSVSHTLVDHGIHVHVCTRKCYTIFLRTEVMATVNFS